MASRNFAAMTDEGLLRSLRELRDGEGEAVDKAAGAGRDPAEDLAGAQAAARRRCLLLAGEDEAWDRVREAAEGELRELGVPEALLGLVRVTGRLLLGTGDGHAQLGGRPRLREPWPAAAHGPLHHLAQVDLAAAPSALHRLGLPDEGLLTVFHDVARMDEGQGGWGEWPGDADAQRVLLVPPDAPVAAWPDALAEDGRHAGQAVRVELEADLGVLVEALIATEEGEPPDGHEDWYAFADEVWRTTARGAGSGSRHKLLGVPDAVQDDPLAECPVQGRAGAPREGTPDLRAARAADWRLLLQLDSEYGAGADDDVSWMWGDAGTLYVCVQDDDLLARDLGRCWTVMQCL